ncbi:hypothetical protein PR048_017399 [Dryococelus australis]|uniref:Uncharacterized protein n=1 Tax=Dryococelus australis TaxID=614101 RepID=A0ABQ9H9N8_9NEOP|nr:hypothetical protein PR048_017399 [Dryococelus australis]
MRRVCYLTCPTGKLENLFGDDVSARTITLRKEIICSWQASCALGLNYSPTLGVPPPPHTHISERGGCSSKRLDSSSGGYGFDYRSGHPDFSFSWCSKRGSDKSDIAKRIKCPIVAMRKALNWRIVLSHACTCGQCHLTRPCTPRSHFETQVATANNHCRWPNQQQHSPITVDLILAAIAPAASRGFSKVEAIIDLLEGGSVADRHESTITDSLQIRHVSLPARHTSPFLQRVHRDDISLRYKRPYRLGIKYFARLVSSQSVESRELQAGVCRLSVKCDLRPATLYDISEFHMFQFSPDETRNSVYKTSDIIKEPAYTWSFLFSAFDPDKCGGDKGYFVTRTKCAIACTKRKALNLRAVFWSCFVYRPLTAQSYKGILTHVHPVQQLFIRYYRMHSLNSERYFLQARDSTHWTLSSAAEGIGGGGGGSGFKRGFPRNIKDRTHYYTWNYFPSDVTNSTGNMPVSGPVKICALKYHRPADIFERLTLFIHTRQSRCRLKASASNIMQQLYQVEWIGKVWEAFESRRG